MSRGIRERTESVASTANPKIASARPALKSQRGTRKDERGINSSFRVETSLVTALPLFAGLDLDQGGQAVVGGHDIRQSSFPQAVDELHRRSNVFDPALIEAVRRGRREEFARFTWEGEVPDPQDEATFLRSKVNPARATEGRGRSCTGSTET